ncbi:MAG TPA: hypothetical protein VHT05_01435 [Candidatus Elarobacter sp.]|nr:hypothetical protein [Candidatus Elarobacter sp.]
MSAAVAAGLVCACSGPRPAATSGAPSAAPSASAPAAAPSAHGPLSSPVSRAGQSGAVPLDPAQRAEVAAVAAKVSPAERARLRYALATGDDGKAHLVVYDGEGLDARGQDPTRRHEYVVFRVLNRPGGWHYDPQENAIIAPIPPPPERDAPH